MCERHAVSDKRHSNTHVNTRRQLGIPTLSWRMMCGLSYLHTKVLAFRPGGIFRQPICHLCSPVAGPEKVLQTIGLAESGRHMLAQRSAQLRSGYHLWIMSASEQGRSAPKAGEVPKTQLDCKPKPVRAFWFTQAPALFNSKPQQPVVEEPTGLQLRNAEPCQREGA